jgi:hypothetical protein
MPVVACLIARVVDFLSWGALDALQIEKLAYAFDNVSRCRKGKKSLLHKGLTASIQVIS